MLSEPGSIMLYGQKFEGTALPEVREVGEETRLRAAAIGSYELWFRQQPLYEFSGAFLLNDEKPVPERHEQQKQFDVSEDIAEVEKRLTIQSTSDICNLDSIEIIPLDWRENPVEFTVLDASESQRTISYRKDAPVESLKLKLSGINVFEVETIDAVVLAKGKDYSPGKVSALIKRSEDIRVDRLDNSHGSVRRIEEHLLTFLRLLLEKVPNRTFDFECNYRHQLVDGGPDVLVPVLYQQSLTLPAASELFPNLLPQLRYWHENSSPPEGVFDFGVRVYGAGLRESVPVLHLTAIVLPIESIAGWNDTRVN